MKTSHKSGGYTLMAKSILKLRVIKTGRSQSEFWSSDDNSDSNATLSLSKWSMNVQNLSTSSIDHNRKKNFVNVLINDSVKVNYSGKTTTVRKKGGDVVMLNSGENLQGNKIKIKIKIKTADSILNITNVTRFFVHFHALLIRRRGEVGPQDHLEVGVEVGRQLHTLNCLEERHQIEESSVGSFTTSNAAVVNNSDAFITVVTGNSSYSSYSSWSCWMLDDVLVLDQPE